MTTQRKWREWLTEHLLALWLQGDAIADSIRDR